MKEKLFSVTAKDLEWSYFVGPGKGGQAKQKCSSGVQCTHSPSGAIGRCSEDRSQLQNKRDAFHKMANTIQFRKWVALKVMEIDEGKTLEKSIDDSMTENNIITEVKIDGKWGKIDCKELTDEEEN